MATNQPNGSLEPLPNLVKRIVGYRPSQVLVLFGLSVFVVTVSQLVIDPEPLHIQLLEVGLPAVLITPLFYTAATLGASNRPKSQQAWILVMSLLFAFIASGTVLVIILSEIMRGGNPSELFFPIVVSSAAGIGVGSLAGVNYENVQRTERVTR